MNAPHCSVHQAFDTDCLECSDALNRGRPREVYEFVNGKRAKAMYRDGQRTSLVFEGSHFWDRDDTAWFDATHRRIGLMSYVLPIRNPSATFINFVS